MSPTSVEARPDQLAELVVFLEGVIREERKHEKPPYKFVDTGLVNQLVSNRNHVLFGRRGSGKSALLRELEARCVPAGVETIVIDMESIAQTSFPNLVVEILLIIFRELHARVKPNVWGRMFGGPRRRSSERIASVLSQLEAVYERPDQSKQKIFGREQQEVKKTLEPEVAAVQNVLRLAASISKSDLSEIGFEEEAVWTKITALFNGIGNYRALIKECLNVLGGRTLYLLIDDFYQIDRFHQPLIADYLKRLCRQIPCYVKIATVRNRTLLFVRDNLTEAGMQAGQDFSDVDLDYSLSDFTTARNFLTTILHNACEGLVQTEALFGRTYIDTMDTLTEASGGNPRDFINLLIRIIRNKQPPGPSAIITPSDVRQGIVSYYHKIREEAAEAFSNFAILDMLLKEVTALCKEQDNIGFYMSREDMKVYQAVTVLVGQLADSRFIHLLTSTYPAPIPADNPATAYLLSMGIYSEFLPDQRINLVNRGVSARPFAKFAASTVADRVALLAPELALIAKVSV